MGMYDEIDFECVCPVCHGKVDNFQSKSGECILETLKPTGVDNFYSPCKKCGCWLDFTKEKDNHYWRTVEGKYDMKKGKRGILPKYCKLVVVK